jgi:hypothetical protein
MLTDEDVQKLVSVFATKKDLQEFREEFSGVKENVQAVLNILENQNKPIVELQQENVMSTGILKRHENWIKQIAQATNINLAIE